MDTNKMTIDKAQLKSLAEDSLTGDWYEAGDLRYEDRKTGDIHGLHHDDDRFIAAAGPATVLALLAEIERMEQYAELEAKGSDEAAQDLIRLVRKNRQLQAENEALRTGQAIKRLSGDEVREALNGAYYQARDTGSDGEQCRAGVLAVIEAAMGKEASYD